MFDLTLDVIGLEQEFSGNLIVGVRQKDKQRRLLDGGTLIGSLGQRRHHAHGMVERPQLTLPLMRQPLIERWILKLGLVQKGRSKLIDEFLDLIERALGLGDAKQRHIAGDQGWLELDPAAGEAKDLRIEFGLTALDPRDQPSQVGEGGCLRPTSPKQVCDLRPGGGPPAGGKKIGQDHERLRGERDSAPTLVKQLQPPESPKAEDRRLLLAA
ncbi:hypothetical protein [Ensifer sp.]|uniref:hypothetical protein n=1 Tax=Ensifer sp. TaxID=1872086 RepID=UPI00289A0B04|nr:hypothetical protein [Ensifer sp.]